MIELGVTPTMIQPVILCGGESSQPQRAAARCAAIRSPGVVTLEPLMIGKGRGSAPALTLAAVHSVTADDPVLLAMPAEQPVADDEAFRPAIERGAALAQQGFIVTFGVPPRTPAAGRGYIRAGRPLGGDAAYVEALVEKADRETAQESAACGSFLWNSGIFAVRASVWLEAIALFRRDIFAACERAYRQGRRDGGSLRFDGPAFEACPADSIDYAVMERVAQEGGPLQAVVVQLALPVTRTDSGRSPSPR